MNILHCSPLVVTPGSAGLRHARHAQIRLALAWPLGLALVLAMGAVPRVHAAAAAAEHAPAAADHGAAAQTAASKAPAKKPASAAAAAESTELAVDLKKALKDNLIDKKNLKLVITDKPPDKPAAAAPKAAGHEAPKATADHGTTTVAVRKPVAHAPAAASPRASRDYIKARAAALTGHAGGDAGSGRTWRRGALVV